MTQRSIRKSADIIDDRNGLMFSRWKHLCESPPVLPDPLEACRNREVTLLPECMDGLKSNRFVSPIRHERENKEHYVPSISRRLQFADQITNDEDL